MAIAKTSGPTGFLGRWLVPFLTALSENTYLSAIRAGMVSVVPLTIIGGLFTVVAHPPIPSWEARVAPYADLLQVGVTGTFGLLAVFVCFAIAYDLGQRFKQEAVVSATMATLVFLLIQTQYKTPPTFSGNDFEELPALALRLNKAARPIDAWLAGRLSPATRSALGGTGGAPDADALLGVLVPDLDAIVQGPSIHDPERFAGITLRSGTAELLARKPAGDDLQRLNRLLIEDAYPLEAPRIQKRDQTLSMAGLGSGGLFTAILVAMVAVRVQKFMTDRNAVIRLPEGVPPVVYESFLSLTPMIVLVLGFWVLRFVLGVDINAVVQAAFKPAVFALNTLPGILVYAFLVTMLWSVGINGDNTMDAIVAPIFLQYLAANVDATGHGLPLPYITANGFFTTFVNVGGTGATIALALVLMNSKDPGFRKVSRISLPTQVFQINEPIFFGIPIVLNPIFMVPYVLNAMILTAGSYLLMHWNLIRRPFVNVPWTTPPIIGHYLTTGGDWRAAAWGVASIGIAMLVYWPFARAAERQRSKAAADAADAAIPPAD
ncbi:MAG: PTS sugar transporter subunit IIC [Verrucomicrobia bacterium]|nr:MAG: PTS sugar transporter subunit IIC [Verrucomicrobiota bacterium]